MLANFDWQFIKQCNKIIVSPISILKTTLKKPFSIDKSNIISLNSIERVGIYNINSKKIKNL